MRDLGSDVSPRLIRREGVQPENTDNKVVYSFPTQKRRGEKKQKKGAGRGIWEGGS